LDEPKPYLLIRTASVADQKTIEQIVTEADINANDLDWQRFTVAEMDGAVIGTGQVKRHKDDTRELASIAVRPAWQGQGIASRIIQALLQCETEPVYLICEEQAEAFYARFGFRKLAPSEFPHMLAVIRRAFRMQWPEFEPSIMRRDGSGD
jgi:N-acetylglutamate synthase-like GNAT family acetyltransferase